MSMDLEGYRKKANALFEEEKFEEVVELLTDEVLEEFKDAELYAFKARSAYRLRGDSDEIMRFAQKAIDADPNYYLGYMARGNAWSYKLDDDKAISDYTKTIELKSDSATAYYNRGIVWNRRNEYDKAISDYSEAIRLNPVFTFAYTNRGIVWYNKGEYEKAISDYSKAIEINPAYALAYHNRGIAWSGRDEYEKAISDYSKAIKLNTTHADVYYNRGYAIKTLGKDLEKSIADFKQYLTITPKKGDIWATRARNYIKELHEKIKDNEINEISAITSEIKKLLLISKGCITHYTGLSIARKLILDDDNDTNTENNEFRISEGAFLNDTSEGTELFKFLDYKFSSENEDGLVQETFAPKPFIGSFVAESKHDDLNLWRFYGKEQGVEAKGCAITLRIKEFIEAINHSILKGNEKQAVNSEDDINFYRVAYWDHNLNKINFQIPNSVKKDETALTKLMVQLKEKVANYNADDKSILEKYLNSIAFLFKSDAYKNENELRLVIKGIEFEKKFDMEVTPPRVYIELINIRPLIEKITLGPKVDKPDEWAAAFHYSFDKETDENRKPKKILISRLPYK